MPAGRVLGGVPGQGRAQVMSGLEVGRIQVAARAVGVALGALDDAVRYSQERESFDRSTWQHQAVGNLIADMATKVRAARLMTVDAAVRFDSGERSDLEAGMAKLLAFEGAAQVDFDALRVHGGYGYSKEYDVERYHREAPLMISARGPTRSGATSSSPRSSPATASTAAEGRRPPDVVRPTSSADVTGAPPDPRRSESGASRRRARLPRRGWLTPQASAPPPAGRRVRGRFVAGIAG